MMEEAKIGTGEFREFFDHQVFPAEDKITEHEHFDLEQFWRV